jgi:hypothetical protein
MSSFFFCKPVDVVKWNTLRACCIDGGVCNVGVGGGIIPAWDFTLKKWMGDGDWRIALAMDWRTSPWMHVRGGDGDLGVRAAF